MKQPAFWQQARTTLPALALAPLAWLYKIISHRRSARAPRYKASCPVICIGNITMGGAGKTPTARAIANLLQEQGRNPVFLSRGYGGQIKSPTLVTPHHTAQEVGDEPLLLAKTAPVCVAADRVAGAKFCEVQGFDCIIMDDGFQNPDLHKDFSLLVIDGGFGQGNGQLFPAGPLRESFSHAVQRAHALICIGTDQTQLLSAPQAAPLPTFQAQITPQTPFLGDGPWLAFAGLARPEKFFTTLKQNGHTLAKTISFPDHYAFKTKDLARLKTQADNLKARLVTTEKDAMRLPAEFLDHISLYTIHLTWQNKEDLKTLLQDHLQ